MAIDTTVDPLPCASLSLFDLRRRVITQHFLEKFLQVFRAMNWPTFALLPANDFKAADRQCGW